MNAWTRTLLIIASLALIFVANGKRSELRKYEGGVAVINLSLLLQQFPEYKAVSSMKSETTNEAVSLNRNGASRAFFALETERNLFTGASDVGRGVFSELSEKASMNKLDRAFFEIKSEFGARRDRIFENSRDKLDEAYKSASSIRPENRFEKEKLRLFNIRIKLESLNEDAFVMPEYRAAELKEQTKEIEHTLKQAESSYASRITERFRSGSEDVRAELDEQLSKLELELQSELYAALSYSEQTLHSDAWLEAEKSSKGDGESIEARRKIASSVQLVRGNSANEAPSESLDNLAENISEEYLRRLTRKAPAIAERSGYTVIISSDYAGLSSAKDITSEFVF